MYDFLMMFGTMLMVDPGINSIPELDIFSYSTVGDTNDQCREIPGIPGGNLSHATRNINTQLTKI